MAGLFGAFRHTTAAARRRPARAHGMPWTLLYHLPTTDYCQQTLLKRRFGTGKTITCLQWRGARRRRGNTILRHALPTFIMPFQTGLDLPAQTTQLYENGGIIKNNLLTAKRGVPTTILRDQAAKFPIPPLW